MDMSRPILAFKEGCGQDKRPSRTADGGVRRCEEHSLMASTAHCARGHLLDILSFGPRSWRLLRQGFLPDASCGDPWSPAPLPRLPAGPVRVSLMPGACTHPCLRALLGGRQHVLFFFLTSVPSTVQSTASVMYEQVKVFKREKTIKAVLLKC